MAKKRSLIDAFATAGFVLVFLSLGACREEKKVNLEKTAEEVDELDFVASQFPPPGTSEVRAFSLPTGVFRVLDNEELNPESGG